MAGIKQKIKVEKKRSGIKAKVKPERKKGHGGAKKGPFYLKEAIIEWQEGDVHKAVENRSYDNWKDLQSQVMNVYDEKDLGYNKNKIKFVWDNGATKALRVDVGPDDFNLSSGSLKDYFSSNKGMNYGSTRNQKDVDAGLYKWEFKEHAKESDQKCYGGLMETGGEIKYDVGGLIGNKIKFVQVFEEEGFLFNKEQKVETIGEIVDKVTARGKDHYIVKEEGSGVLFSLDLDQFKYPAYATEDGVVVTDETIGGSAMPQEAPSVATETTNNDGEGPSMAKGGQLGYNDFVLGEKYFNSSEGGIYEFIGKDESGRLKFIGKNKLVRIFSPKKMSIKQLPAPKSATPTTSKQRLGIAVNDIYQVGNMQYKIVDTSGGKIKYLLKWKQEKEWDPNAYGSIRIDPRLSIKGFFSRHNRIYPPVTEKPKKK